MVARGAGYIFLFTPRDRDRDHVGCRQPLATAQRSAFITQDKILVLVLVLVFNADNSESMLAAIFFTFGGASLRTWSFSNAACSLSRVHIVPDDL